MKFVFAHTLFQPNDRLAEIRAPILSYSSPLQTEITKGKSPHPSYYPEGLHCLAFLINHMNFCFTDNPILHSAILVTVKKIVRAPYEYAKDKVRDQSYLFSLYFIHNTINIEISYIINKRNFIPKYLSINIG